MDRADFPILTDRKTLYERSRTRFVLGAGLTLDEAYRPAHLPMVAPDHPRVIARKDGAPYEMGRRAAVVSLVLHVARKDLAASPAFKALEAELGAAPFAKKIAWAASEARRDRLHAMICGSMTPGREAPALTAAQRAARGARRAGGRRCRVARSVFTQRQSRPALSARLSRAARRRRGADAARSAAQSCNMRLRSSISSLSARSLAASASILRTACSTVV